MCDHGFIGACVECDGCGQAEDACSHCGEQACVCYERCDVCSADTLSDAAGRCASCHVQRRPAGPLTPFDDAGEVAQ